MESIQETGWYGTGAWKKDASEEKVSWREATGGYKFEAENPKEHKQVKMKILKDSEYCVYGPITFKTEAKDYKIESSGTVPGPKGLSGKSKVEEMHYKLTVAGHNPIVCDANGNEKEMPKGVGTHTIYFKLTKKDASKGIETDGIKIQSSAVIDWQKKDCYSVVADYKPASYSMAYALYRVVEEHAERDWHYETDSYVDSNGNTQYYSYKVVDRYGTRIEWYTNNSPQDPVVSNEIYKAKVITYYKKKINTQSLTWNANGGIEVEKVDKDDPDGAVLGSDSKLDKAEIAVSGAGSQKTDKATDGKKNTKGRARFNNLKSEKEYTISEPKRDPQNPPHYGYTKLPKKVKVTVKNGQYIKIEGGKHFRYKNEKRTGNLVLVKKDADTDKPLEGFKFKIKSPKGYVGVMDNDYLYDEVPFVPRKEVTGKYVIGSMKDDLSKEEATTFITDSEGMIKLVNILDTTWNYKGQPYEIEEISANDQGENGRDKYYGYTVTEDKKLVDPEYIEWNTGDNNSPEPSDRKNLADTEKITVEVKRRKSTHTRDVNTTYYNQVNIYDKKKYVKLTGNVWEDVANLQKNENGDNIKGDGDKAIAGMKVTLKDVSDKENPLNMGKIDSGINAKELAAAAGKSVDAEGNYITYTKEDGSYEFNDVLIGTGVSDKIHNRTVNGARCYYIEFEYDGEVYTSVKTFNEIDAHYDNTSATEITSKAVEVSDERTKVDGSYTEVKGDGEGTSSSSRSGDKGYSKIQDDKFRETYELTDQSGDEEAKAKSSNKKTFDEQGEGGNRNVDKFSAYENYSDPEINKLTATTAENPGNDDPYGVLGALEKDGTPSTGLRDGKKSKGVETPDSIRKNELEELAERNYGTVEREKVNLAISNDLDNVEVRVNGYKHTYKYARGASRAEYTDIEDGDDDDMHTYKNFRLDCKFKNKFGYIRPLYVEDIVYDGEDTCQVYVVYKVTVANISNSLTANVTDLAEYHDSRNTICGVALEGEANDGIFENGEELPKTEIPGTENQDENGNTYSYSVSHVDALKDTQIKAGEKAVVYVKFHVDPRAVSSTLESKSGIEMSNVVEINGFYTSYGSTTYYHDAELDGNGNWQCTRSGLYASIDRNSAPGNAIIEYGGETTKDGSKKLSTRTYEDDTSIAPPIMLTLKENYRTISGTVFRDSTTTGDGKTASSELKAKDTNGNATYTSEGSVDTGKERIGDGIYTPNKEDTVGNVTVQLLYYDKDKEEQLQENPNDPGDSLATLYTYAKGSKTYRATKTPAQMQTTEGGGYLFTGVVPDEYILRFIYSDGSIVYKAGTTEKYDNVDPDYYKATVVKSSIIEDALNNNGIVGEGNQETLTTAKAENGQDYDSKKWHVLSEFEDGKDKYTYKETNKLTDKEIENTVRFSDAMDSNEIVEAAMQQDYAMNNAAYADENDSSKYTGEPGRKGAHYTQKEAYTGVMNIQVELDNNEPDAPLSGPNQGSDNKTTTQEIEVENSDGTIKVIDEYSRTDTKNVDFGIVQKPRHAYDLNKEIANIKIILAGGQVLIDGDPTHDSINYLKYLPEYSRRFTRVNMEIDNELLVGAKMEVTYKITAVNNSEVNYVTKGYYRYGRDKNNASLETIKFSKIFDYLDDQLTYDKSLTDALEYDDKNAATISVLGKIGDEQANDIIKTEDQAKKYLTDLAIERAKKYEVILMLEGDKELTPGDKEEWKFTATRALSPSDSLDYYNEAEVTEITTTNTPSHFSRPGDYVPTNNEESSTTDIEKGQEDNFKSNVVINSPTGADKSYTVYIIGAIALIVLGSGIIIIKRKVL